MNNTMLEITIVQIKETKRTAKVNSTLQPFLKYSHFNRI